jgi:LacI family transcriptional regulator
MARQVTIQDISRAAGTSPSTVSRVLTGNAAVSPTKRAAVEQAIKQLNYRPNHIARSLKTSTTYSVGLLLNEINNPFYSALARGVEEEANRHGYSLILCNTNEDPARECQYLQVLEDKQVDGIILGPTGENLDYITQLASRRPIVQVDRQLQSLDLTAVLVDNEHGAYQAVRYLIEKGHRRIGIFQWERYVPTLARRQAGYERALAESGIELDSSLIVRVPSLTPLQTAERAQEFLTQHSRPTALFALNNQIGLGMYSAIQRLGLRIPEDVALVVFDDLDFFAMVRPSITAVAQPAFSIGERAMRSLTRQIEENDRCAPEVITLPTQLMIRESA